MSPEFSQPLSGRWLRGFLAAVLAVFATAMTHSDEPSREYRIKAAYLYNLTKFIIWPDEKIWPENAPITVCIYGFNPFDTYIEKLRERTAKGHPIALHYAKEQSGLIGCKVVFISQYNPHQPDLRKLQADMPMLLTVGDDPDFIVRNGMIGLVASGNNVQMDIHLTRARQAGFAVSADLLEIAHKVE